MTIKVNIEFSVDETNKESMRTLSRFFSSFEEHIEVNLQSAKVSPFDEPVEKENDWFITDNQVDEISKYLEADKDNCIIEGYERKFKEEYPASKRVHMMKLQERNDIHSACKCIANEVLSGGIIMVGRTYTHGKKISLCIKDHNHMFHEISFTRAHNGRLLSLNQVDALISSYMINVGVGSKYCKSYDIDQRNKTSVSLPSDVKPKQEQ